MTQLDPALVALLVIPCAGILSGIVTVVTVVRDGYGRVAERSARDRIRDTES